MHWLGGEWHKIVIAFAGVCHLWDKSVDAKNFLKRLKIERRIKIMNPEEIIAIIEAAEGLLPVIEKGIADVKVLIGDIEAGIAVYKSKRGLPPAGAAPAPAAA